MSTKPKTSEAESAILNLDSRQVGDEQFADILHDSLAPVADARFLKSDNSSRASDSSNQLQVYTLGDLSALHISYQSFVYKRTHKHITDSGHEDSYLLVTQRKGGSCTQTDHSVLLETGDCALFDMGKPLVGHMEKEFDGYYIFIPKRALHQLGFSLNGRADRLLSGSSPAGAMLSGAIFNMGASLDQATPKQLQAISHTLPAMINHLMMPDISSDENPAVRSATLAAIMTYIDLHLHEPELGVDSIVKALHRSRASVYRLFTEEGGIAAYIQRRRLHACYQELALDIAPEKRIIDIAVKWGFNNHSHFTRLFRESYGITPSSLRDAVMAEELNSVNRPAQNYSEHINRRKQWILQSA